MYQEKNFFPILVVVVVEQRGERGGDHTGCGRPCRPGAPAQRVHKVQKAPQGVLRYDSIVFPCLGILGSKTTKKKVLNWVYVWGVFWVYISSFPLIILIIYIAARVPEQSGDCTKSLEGVEMLCLKKT